MFYCGNDKSNKGSFVNYRYEKTSTRRTYFIDFNFRGDFEIIFNGISIKRNKSNAVSNGLEYLNPYISKTGSQSITLIVKPVDSGSKIQTDDVKDYYIDIVYTNNGEAAPVHHVKRCTFSPISKPVDSLVNTWTFDAEVPFEINNLLDAADLTQQDPNKLLEEVLTEYQKVSSLINNGNIKDYMQLYKSSREREMVSMYYNESKQKEYLDGLEKRALSSKGFMQPINDYKILIHPNKKVVSLINSQGKTPLCSEDNNGKIKTYGLQLYRSSKTGKLEVY